MSRKGHVVIVDPFSPFNRVAQQFRKAGYDCVRVETIAGIPEAYRASFSLDDYVDNITHTGDFAGTLEAVAGYRPAAVLPGGERGVEFADRLAEALGLPNNGTDLSAARRDKFTMVETLKEAGVRGARQILVTDEDELRAWHERLGRRVVAKPIRSAGGDGIRFCGTPHQSVAAYRSLSAADSFFEFRNEGVVAQEYLYGGEYVVNTVSRDGRHHLTDIWKTTRLTANGVLDLCDSIRLLPRRSPEGGPLGDYAEEVLGALGIRHGLGHLEVKLTPEGPCLVEMGARIPGGDIPYYARLGLGESQIDWVVDAYVAPQRFHERCETDYRIQKHFVSVAMISPLKGTLRSYPHLDAVRGLESVLDVRTLVEPGGQVLPTVDDFTYPMIVNLCHEIEETVLRDYTTLRFLDGEGFYDLA
ncbi:biotin carboxylase [Streptomyces sp. TS71-3]|uniref:biotin carboxylase n=1 Tax=Streptomyces sp. TS71-3 TaxID=2733862 RepID=UPI001B2BCC1D|nr:biotin carboxylase [Streptomyces sp. TS71-3]GHJ42334.1 ATP-grasp domain-containing protein [Streptomyces sp. TS71-3]